MIVSLIDDPSYDFVRCCIIYHEAQHYALKSPFLCPLTSCHSSKSSAQILMLSCRSQFHCCWHSSQHLYNITSIEQNMKFLNFSRDENIKFLFLLFINTSLAFLFKRFYKIYEIYQIPFSTAKRPSCDFVHSYLARYSSSFRLYQERINITSASAVRLKVI